MIYRPLGKLNFIRIWHDNSGVGDYASWFPGAIVVKDLQKRKKYNFLINKWFAVEYDDGEVYDLSYTIYILRVFFICRLIE